MLAKPMMLAVILLALLPSGGADSPSSEQPQGIAQIPIDSSRLFVCSLTEACSVTVRDLDVEEDLQLIAKPTLTNAFAGQVRSSHKSAIHLDTANPYDFRAGEGVVSMVFSFVPGVLTSGTYELVVLGRRGMVSAGWLVAVDLKLRVYQSDTESLYQQLSRLGDAASSSSDSYIYDDRPVTTPPTNHPTAPGSVTTSPTPPTTTGTTSTPTGAQLPPILDRTFGGAVVVTFVAISCAVACTIGALVAGCLVRRCYRRKQRKAAKHSSSSAFADDDCVDLESIDPFSELEGEPLPYFGATLFPTPDQSMPSTLCSSPAAGVRSPRTEAQLRAAAADTLAGIWQTEGVQRDAP